MPFVGSMSLTNLRGDYSGRPFVCVTPATIVFQAQIDITQTGKRATHTYTNVTTGAYTDIKPGMLVLVHEDQNDLYNYWFRGRPRSAATATNVLTNETDQSFFVNWYITVIEDYDVFPRLARRTNDTNYIDYEVAFTTLPPAIGGLQSSYVVQTTSTSASLSFAPTVTAMESGASISTYSWDVGDGTITVGSASTKDITVSFPAYQLAVNDGHRWVSLTATDSNSVPHTFRFEVYVGNLHTAPFVLQDVDNITWSADWNTGYNGQITVHGDASSLLPNNRITVAYIDSYNGTSTPYNTNVALVGRLRSDSITLTGEDYVQETSFSVEGFGTQLANLACPKFAVFDKDTPAEWNEIEDPTPVRAIWHTVTRYSTFATVCAFDFLSAYNNYVAGVIEIESQGMLDALNRIAARIVGQVTFAPSGEWRLRQTASYLSDSDKSGLTTIASLTTQDMLSFTVDRAHTPRVGYVEGGGLLYNTTTKQYIFYLAKAPSIMNTSGEEVQQINGQILDSADPSGASAELSTRVGAHLARNQNLYRINTQLFDAWREIVPSNYDWYTFTIASTDNNRGISIGTGRYYLLESVSWSADIATSALSINAQFVQDVDAFGTSQDTSVIPNTVSTPYPNNPVQLPYGGNYLPDGVGTTWYPTDNPSDNELNPIPGSALDPLAGAPEGNQPVPNGNEGIYLVPFTGGVVGCNFISTGGATYTIDVNGTAEITTGGAVTYDFTQSDNGFAQVSAGNGEELGTYSAGVGWVHSDDVNDIGVGNRGISISKSLASATVTAVTMTFNYTGGTFDNPAFTAVSVILNNTIIQVDRTTQGDGTALTVSWSGSVANVTSIRLFVRSSRDGTAPYSYSGSCTITSVEITTSSAQFQADAFYYGFENEGVPQSFTVGEGFLIDGAAVPTIPGYSNQHNYTGITHTGDGSQITFEYAGFPTAEPRFLTVRIRGHNAQ